MFVILAVIISVLAIVNLVANRKHNYWKKKNVKHLKPMPFLGNYGDHILQKKTLGEVTKDICEKYPNEPIVGAYYGTEPVAIVQDPEYLKMVTTKDFYYFNGRDNSNYSSAEPGTNNMFFHGSDKWRILRQNMTPLFTSSKMKNMFPLIKKGALKLEKVIDEELENSKELEVRSLITKFTIDNITSAAFGIDANVLTSKDVSNNPFKKIADAIFQRSSLFSSKFVFRSVWPRIFYSLGLTLISDEINTFFSSVIINVFKERNWTPSGRNDFIDLIMEFSKTDYITGDSIRNSKDETNEKATMKVNNELLVALSTLIFSTGFETSATTSSFTLYELAKNQDIQNKVLKEIDEYLVSRNGDLDYDIVANLPYLEQCMNETIRLYPVLHVITREAYEDYTFPNGVHLDAGIRIHIPLYYLHRNPKYFPEPHEYKPERFSPEEKNNITPYSYLGFGEGPRVCIGRRFALMQVKSGLITILKKYRVELAPGMPREVSYVPTSFVTLSTSGIQLRFIEREGWQKRMYSV